MVNGLLKAQIIKVMKYKISLIYSGFFVIVLYIFILCGTIIKALKSGGITVSELIKKLQRLPKDCAEFKEGFNVLMDNIDSLTEEEQILFANLAVEFINVQAENERVKIRLIRCIISLFMHHLCVKRNFIFCLILFLWKILIPLW